MAHADIHADTHVFGSTRGYGTVVSSSGVRADETRELEQFQFGEAATADRIARLESNAVMTGRPLRSGRFAISRMLPAGNDDAGRPTIEVVTLLLEARDYEACAGALPTLAEDAGFWRGARASAASGARVPAIAPVADANDPRVFRLFDLWRAAVRAGAAGVVPETESDSVLRLVASLDPVDRARCRWGIGLLSISAPADLCSVASGTSTHGARDVLRPAQSGAWHCGNESEYAAFRVTSGLARLPSVAEIEVNGRELGVPEWALGSAPSAQPKRAEKRPQSLLPFAIGSAVMSTAVLAVALVMWERRGGGETKVVPLASGSDGKAAVQAPAGAKDQLNLQIPTVPAASSAPPSMTPASASPPSPVPEPVSGPAPAAPAAPAAPPTPSDVPPATAPLQQDGGNGDPAAESQRPGITETKSTTLETPSPDALSIIDAAKRIDARPLRMPLRKDFAGNMSLGITIDQEWKSAINAECERARHLAGRAVEALAELVKRDRELKSSAKERQNEGAPISAIETCNGFIVTKSVESGNVAQHRGKHRPLLQRKLVTRWIEFLERLVQVMPLEPSPVQAAWNTEVDRLTAMQPSDVRGVVHDLLSAPESSGDNGEAPSKDLNTELLAAGQVSKTTPPSDDP